MSLTIRSFETPQEELEYYKNKARDLELELEETKFALDEFQLSSKELEEELEKEIDSTERRYNEIKIRNEGMRQEVEDWKVCCCSYLAKNLSCIFDVFHRSSAKINDGLLLFMSKGVQRAGKEICCIVYLHG